MSYSHVVYIDEAGDEGFGKLRNQNRGGQSQWLVLGAAIVRGDNDLELPHWRDAIMARFPQATRPDLHFRHHKHDQKVVICQEIANRPLFSCLTFSNKATILEGRWASTFKQPGYLYNYLTRWLLERVTAFCLSDATSNGIEPCRVKVVFSRRGGTNYQAMREYMELMRDGRELVQPVRSINWSIFDPADIVVENHSKWAGLQISDAITSAYFCAVDPNPYGNYETRYADLLRPLAIRVRGSALDAGVTPVPSLHRCAPNQHQNDFFRSFVN